MLRTALELRLTIGSIGFGLLLGMAGAAEPAAKERLDKVFLQGNVAGEQKVQLDASGAVRAEYSFNDRGRGDHITATWKLDVDGVPVEYEGRGNDYMKAPVEEHFKMANGVANWKNRSEQGQRAIAGKAFYLRTKTHLYRIEE